MIGGTESNMVMPTKAIPPEELTRRKAKRCTVSVATEPSWIITVEAKNTGDQSTPSQRLSSDISLHMAPTWNGLTLPESDIKRRIERLETLLRQLGLTLVLPEISPLATSQSVDISESETSNGSGDSSNTAIPARRDDPDDDEILLSWEDDVSDDEVVSAEEA